MSKVSGKIISVFSEKRNGLFRLAFIFPFHIMHSIAA